MTEYDDENFFNQYAKMSRSMEGLNAAGGWHQFKELIPPLKGKTVLDLGCGYGWHCVYAVQQGADKVTGLDCSKKMLAEALNRNKNPRIEYKLCDIEYYEYPKEMYDCVISNLALHYVADLQAVYKNIYNALKPGGTFVMNIEHPSFTSGVNEDWVYDKNGQPLYWPVDEYFYEGKRLTNFLDCNVVKYHHTLTTILGGLLSCGFKLTAVEEAVPSKEMLKIDGMINELRRPMMLLVRADKQHGAN